MIIYRIVPDNLQPLPSKKKTHTHTHQTILNQTNRFNLLQLKNYHQNKMIIFEKTRSRIITNAVH